MKTAVVLFNLGGPDKPESVRPFLFNLFNVPAIIGAPGPIRWLLAQAISRRRAPVAREIYANLGGGSPLLPNTVEQLQALEQALQFADMGEVRCFIAMRYWHPLTEEAVQQVVSYGPDRIVLLPLYPQFSTTTTGSSVNAWRQAGARAGLDVPVFTACCYPTVAGFIDKVAGSITDVMERFSAQKPRVLFSAHGLPKKVVDRGDPYQWQVEQTAGAVVARLAIEDLDWVVCYQSRVGPLEWIGPSTDDEIKRAGSEKKPLAVVPIAFVSEHSETLVELDIEYAKLAEEQGVPQYERVPTVGAAAGFVDGLVEVVKAVIAADATPCSQLGRRLCTATWSQCPAAVGVGA